MKIPKKEEDEGLVEYAERLSELYGDKYDAAIRKPKGQIFTPKKVGMFMVGMFDIPDGPLRILDPGAGTGTLTAALCERLIHEDKITSLTVDAYENDPSLLPFLHITLESCKMELMNNGQNMEYYINKEDFILHNVCYFKKSCLSWATEKPDFYDIVISNPPYYKLNKDSPQSTVMAELISGQPNIYTLFMALSASMLKPGGEMVFITPRSFCSGLYYKKFREWFLNNIQIEKIHIFESRTDVFDKDEILQESMILKGKNQNKEDDPKIIISTSENNTFSKLKNINVRYNDIVYRKNGDVFIRIPTTPFDLNVLKTIDDWPMILKYLGLEISTGPVIPFRAKKYLLPEMTETSDSAPLLWCHNMVNTGIVWPLNKNKKASAIRVCEETKPLLLPVKNYVLLKRFSSKEQERRLCAAVLLKSTFPYELVGIENHVNYIHCPEGELSIHDAFGIAAILNSSIVDNFFRSLNGNTQVNATDIRSMPFPEFRDIRKIGKIVYESKAFKDTSNPDDIVAEVLGIDIKQVSKER